MVEMKQNTKTKPLTPELMKQVIEAQRRVVAEYYIYKRLARKTKDLNKKEILHSIANDVLEHYKFWMKYSGIEVEPNNWYISKLYWLSQIFGLSFGLNQIKRGKQRDKINFNEICTYIPEALQISKEETQHEKELLRILGKN